MKKIITIIVSALIAVMAFAGCSASTDENHIPITVVGTAPVSSTLETEAPTVATEPIPTTEPADGQFKFGDEVWAVEFAEDGDAAYLVRYAVVGQHDDVIDVLPWFTSDIEGLRESLSYDPDIYQIDMGQVYIDMYDAMAAVAEANGETFEQYWGCTMEDVTNE